MKIVTHNVKFHTDDVFAVAALLLKFPSAEVIRTRDENIISEADVVVDVGGVYDPERNRFDHHQLGGAGVRDSGVPYASFGLVWKKFGKDLCGNNATFDYIEKRLVQMVDAADVGMDLYDSQIVRLAPFSVISLSNLFRPTWKEGEDFDVGFKEAVLWAKSVLQRIIKVENDGEDGRQIVRGAYNKSLDKKLIVIDSDIPIGRELVNDVLSGYSEPIYAVFFRRDHQSWQLLAIEADHTFQSCRKFLPESWRAKGGKELEDATGVPGSIFCHATGFMVVAQTKESALKLAEIALKA